MSSYFKKHTTLFFAISVVVVVLWQLLLPGYVILLDWPAGPLLKFQFSDVTSFINAPSGLILTGLNYFLPSWIIQKLLMFGIFFLAVYLPLKLLGDKNFKLFSKTSTKYFLALFLAINPFVYERFIAGQWRVLVGYLTVFPLIYFIIEFHSQGIFPDWRQARNIFLTLLVTGFFSVHFLAIDSLIILFYIFYRLFLTVGEVIKNQIVIIDEKSTPNPSFEKGGGLKGESTLSHSFTKKERKLKSPRNPPFTKRGRLWKSTPNHSQASGGELNWFGKIFLAGIVFIITSSYWLIPYLKQGDSVLNNFNSAHQRAFATAQNEEWSVLENVIVMHGFWGEDHKWVEQFKLPKNSPLFMTGFYVLMILVILGLFSFWRDKKYRWLAVWLFLLGVTGIIFSAGVRNNVFQDVNLWLFNNISFWKGFRDTQKWSGVLVVVYALLASRGVGTIGRVVNNKFKHGEQIIVGGGIILILLMAPQMLFGFGRQIKTTWYPPEWTEVSQKLIMDGIEKEKSAKILFLPWHQYYSLQFNDNHLSANPANNFFPGQIILGHNTELWGIKSLPGNIENYSLLEKRITSNNPNPEFINETVKIFKDNNIKYIIWTDDLLKSDIYEYPFLQSPFLKKIIERDNIVLYKIK